MMFSKKNTCMLRTNWFAFEADPDVFLQHRHSRHCVNAFCSLDQQVKNSWRFTGRGHEVVVSCTGKYASLFLVSLHLYFMIKTWSDVAWNRRTFYEASRFDRSIACYVPNIAKSSIWHQCNEYWPPTTDLVSWKFSNGHMVTRSIFCYVLGRVFGVGWFNGATSDQIKSKMAAGHHFGKKFSSHVSATGHPIPFVFGQSIKTRLYSAICRERISILLFGSRVRFSLSAHRTVLVGVFGIDG